MQTAAWGLRRSLRKRSQVLLLLSVLLSVCLRTTAVTLLGVDILVANRGEVMNVTFFFVDFLHIFQGLKVLCAVEFEAHGED